MRTNPDVGDLFRINYELPAMQRLLHVFGSDVHSFHNAFWCYVR